jgi:Tfp pilus assembly protein PilF
MNATPLSSNKINSIIELYSAGNIIDALDNVQNLISQYPNESLLHNISGVCRQETGELEMAVQSFERALEINPDFADAHYNLGLTLQKLNQLDAAIKSYKETLSIEPNYIKVHNNLGAIYLELGQIDNAIKSYENVLIIQPDNAEAHHNLGNALNELGKLDDAIKSYEQALSIQPSYFEVHNNLGSIYYELGQRDQAINSYKQALSINPDSADALNNIGIVYQALDQFDDAASFYKKAISINPEHAEALNNLGNIIKECGQFDEAIEFYKKALTVNPKFEDAHYNLGISLYKLGKTDKAIDTFEQVLTHNPNFADARNFLGTLFQDLGQVDEATNCYVNALAIEPDNSRFHFNLSQLKHYKIGDTQFTHMQSLISSKDLIESERIRLCFALAKAYEDLGNKAELFEVLNEGNKLRKEEISYSIETDFKKHSIIRKLFKSVTTKPSYDPITVRPIFIVGMPRSGTSLVEQIISSHHKVHGAGELNTLDTVIYNYLSQNNALSDKDFFSIRKEYLNSLLNLNFSESIITDKMPINFENIGFILKAFPEAKIIHLRRNAMAVCWSIYKRSFSNKNLGFAYDMRDLAQFYNSYSKLMDFWHELFPNQIYDISYEDLTTNQEEETRNLLDYCELDWDESCLNFYTNKRAVKTASSLQVKEPIYQGSSEVWKKYETQLKLLINNLDYSS